MAVATARTFAVQLYPAHRAASLPLRRSWCNASHDRGQNPRSIEINGDSIV
jgi:hypothetical protein